MVHNIISQITFIQSPFYFDLPPQVAFKIWKKLSQNYSDNIAQFLQVVLFPIFFS